MSDNESVPNELQPTISIRSSSQTETSSDGSIRDSPQELGEYYWWLRYEFANYGKIKSLPVNDWPDWEGEIRILANVLWNIFAHAWISVAWCALIGKE